MSLCTNLTPLFPHRQCKSRLIRDCKSRLDLVGFVQTANFQERSYIYTSNHVVALKEALSSRRQYLANDRGLTLCLRYILFVFATALKWSISPSISYAPLNHPSRWSSGVRQFLAISLPRAKHSHSLFIHRLLLLFWYVSTVFHQRNFCNPGCMPMPPTDTPSSRSLIASMLMISTCVSGSFVCVAWESSVHVYATCTFWDRSTRPVSEWHKACKELGHWVHA